MMTIKLRRNDYEPDDTNHCQHAGLLLDRGFKEWSDDNHNDDIVKLHYQASKIETSEIYQKAYKQWNKQQLSNRKNSATWFAKLENRLFLGMGETSPLEAGITLHHTYGVPYIPGSAVKGVLHHYALKVGISKDIQIVLFGKEASQTDKQDSGEAGYIIFNDAWWIPTTTPALVPEIITVHHQEYYSSQGENAATDFDSPNPNPQIAIQGSFMFSLEGDEAWIKYAIALLKDALKHRGIGAKNSSGYGYFYDDVQKQKSFDNNQKEIIEASLPADQLLQLKVDKLTLENLAEKLGKGRANTSKEIKQENWKTFLKLIQETFSNDIQEWETSKDKFEKRAYKTIYGDWRPDFE